MSRTLQGICGVAAWGLHRNERGLLPVAVTEGQACEQRLLTPPHSDCSHRDQRQVVSGAWLWERGLGHSPGGFLIKLAWGPCLVPEPGWAFSPLSWIRISWLVHVGAGV